MISLESQPEMTGILWSRLRFVVVYKPGGRNDIERLS